MRNRLSESLLLRRVIVPSLIFTLFQLLFSGCEFKPDDVPVNKIVPPPEQGPSVQISLNDSFDTIRIGWETNFTYNIKGTTNTIHSVSVSLEDRELHNYIGEYGQTFDFMLDPAFYGDGLYHLNIKIITSAGSGSIADKLGVEGYLYDMDWPLVIDKTVPRKLNFTSIDSVEKGIKITWEKFNHPSFGHYRLTKSSTAFFGIQDLFISDDPGMNSYTDTAYLEGMVTKYHLYLNGTFAGLVYECINEKEYYHLPKKPKVKYLQNFEIEMSWDPPKNVKLLDYYYLSGNTPAGGTLEDNLIYNHEIRTQRRYVVFGMTNYFGVKYIPKLELQVYPDNILNADTEFTLGDEMPLYQSAFLLPNSSFVLLADNGKLCKFDLSAGITTDSIKFNSQPPDYITVSNNGKFFSYFEDGKFIRRDTRDLRVISILSDSELSGNSQNLSMLGISDTNKLLTVTEDFKLSVYNLTTGLKTAEKLYDGISGLNGWLSPGGNNIITREYDGSMHIVYYQIAGDKITEVGRVDESDLKFGAILNNPFGPGQDIYIVLPDKIEIRNILDFSVKKILELSSIKSVDYQTMKAFGNSRDYPQLAYVYDLETGALVKNLIANNLTGYKFHQNYLFYSGHKLNLNNIYQPK